MDENIVFNSDDVQQNKVYGILSYIGILVLIPLLAAKDSQYARFHANQGLVLFLTDIILWICVGTISAILKIVPIFGWIAATLIGSAVNILLLVFMILGIVYACIGEPKKLPIIGAITIIR